VGSEPSPTPVEFSSHHHFYEFSCSWLLGGAASPAFSSGLFIYSSVRGCPSPPLWRSGCPTLFAMCLFCCCLLFSFSFFPAWGSVCLGGYADLAQGCLWEYHVPLSSPCGLRLPQWYGHWHLVTWEPSWFLHLMWSGNAMRWLGCGGAKVLPLLGGFSCKLYLQRLSKILL
jgi:hypothetical protein